MNGLFGAGSALIVLYTKAQNEFSTGVESEYKIRFYNYLSRTIHFLTLLQVTIP